MGRARTALLGAGGLLAAIGLWQVFAARDEAAAARLLADRAALPRIALTDLVAPAGRQPATLVFADGDDGWFLIDGPAIPVDAQIGFSAQGDDTALPLSDHLPTYCDGGVTLWGTTDGVAAAQFAFCNPALMDLSALRAVAVPVTLVHQDLAWDAVAAEVVRVVADPELRLVLRPQSAPAWPYQQTIDLPWLWHDATDGLPLQDIALRGLPARLPSGAALLGVAVTPAPVQSRQSQDPAGDNILTVTGPAVVRDGRMIVLGNGIEAVRITLRLGCADLACTGPDPLELAGLVAPYRDMALLRAAVDEALEPGAGAATAGLPDLDEFNDATVTFHPVTPTPVTLVYLRLQ